jgi:hypothetical protein
MNEYFRSIQFNTPSFHSGVRDLLSYFFYITFLMPSFSFTFIIISAIICGLLHININAINIRLMFNTMEVMFNTI